MPGFLAHVGATVQCSHLGQAQATVSNPRVLVSGQPTVLLTTPYQVAGCALPSSSGGPCVSAQWLAGTTRVFSNGQPLVMQGGQSICAPTFARLAVVVTQSLVTGI
jgi:hypothetical protein